MSTPPRLLSACAPARPLGVALSGGADSVAMLVTAARLWPGEVHALHVNHGLQAAASTFERHCTETCASLGIPLHVARPDATGEAGDSPEDAARRARYAALAQLARNAGLRCVLLAQHADDQVETLLLALSRGAGLPGLAAMPARFERHGAVFLRPWLDLSGAEIRAWLRDEGVAHVEDPTNADTRFTRNRIRHEVLPALERAFPQWRVTFARSARHAAQAQALLDEMASADLATMEGAPVIDTLRGWPRARQANVLRHWLRSVHGATPSAAQLEELLDQVHACTTRGHRLHLRVANGFVQRAGARLAWTPSV
ncbi:tRNA lysidine(34) synthetase TilS [Ramlibacter algicola]|uniref:tRNA(Ile)-lysidine synthase n=1 Tax=Ramlibacter algicola TaxID=2795217 RepID=A0A934URR4_9BURK|nr:tRNA lysidine(34) synthetase TilS [Ramlibacter algicola]MBK0392963.1 tRNA lysidine(34) synthetase TilS [Ramlibacter algicola]